MEEKRVTAEMREIIEADPFANGLGVELVEIEPGRAKFRLELRPDHLNLFGMVHGAVVFGLADAAFAAASNSFGTKAVAMSVGIDFVAAADPGGELVSEARQVSRAGRTGYYDMVVSDGGGKEVARCRGWAYHTGRPFGEAVR